MKIYVSFRINLLFQYAALKCWGLWDKAAIAYDWQENLLLPRGIV